MIIKYVFFFLIWERYETSWVMNKIISLWDLMKNDICHLSIHEFKFYALLENLNIEKYKYAK